ncbi:TetR/AcrR family transcriptional regulator [Marinactinospora rubrisoli]|uniref:TetR/AcrR family transcriptional regulator n=1 Tax=Marinactinospora rubrisoli TaxID=2715399 RepID=A0ABW2KPH6_9ACTN
MAPGTRDALIEAAADLLDRGGVEAVTLRAVGHQVGVSHNAPYKHFANKEALLAAIAAREATRLVTAPHGEDTPEAALRRTMHDYVTWALEHPARFRLVFGPWTTESPELAAAAHAAHTRLIGTVAAAQRSGVLPTGDPERAASLVRALAHGAADLALAGHLAADGKGHADPHQLIDDLLDHLRTATAATRPAHGGGQEGR